ncbi:MAG TPA: O-antigen ligase family protein [Methylomirabilota bacterium]|nr:O-antigen ligase family protein [Methylomirabilota bacterium]
MRNHISTYIDNAIILLLFVVAGVTPLFFLNQMTEFYEMPKLVFLVVTTVLILGLWIFSWILKGKVIISRTPLDIPLLILLAGVIVSTFFSASKYTAMYGDFPKVHGSAVAWVTYILLYFVTVSNLRRLAQVKTFLYVLYVSATVVAFVTLLSFFNIFLPFDFAKGINFTPTGSSFSTIAFLLLLLPLPLLSLTTPNKYFPVPFAMALATLFGVTVVLTGSMPSLIALLVAFALSLFVVKPHKAKKTLALLVVPVILTTLVLVFAYVPFAGNKLQQMEANFPKEIQLPFAVSWKISASAFRDAPFIGTGPSSYLFNFTSYKPLEFNVLKYWNFSFDTAYNEFLQVLGTLGLIGVVGLVLVCLITFTTSWKNLFVADQEAHQDDTNVLVPALAVSGLLSIVLFAIHATTLVSIIVTFFILAALMASRKSDQHKVIELSMGLKASTSDNKHFDLFPVIIFVVFLVLAVPVLFRTFNVVAADYYHRLALSQANKSGTLTYQYLQKAESLNPQIDLYRVDMAQTNFALANAIVAAKTQQKKNLTDQEKQTVQTLLSQSINEGRISVALNPRSARNWEVLASIYRNIAGVAQNALAFSISSYGQAIQRDPLNPTLRMSVGGIYYAAKNYDLAVRFFTDAANLKPDYANAYYNLAIAYREKGDLQSALVVVNQTVSLLQQNNPNGPDYKVATKLLSDLKAKVAAGQSAQQAQEGQNQPAPASQTNSALQNSNVSNVNVSNLSNPPSVTPAPAVKKNPSSVLPQPTVAPTSATQK